MSKVKFELEFPIHASPSMLYNCLATPSGLEEWFADKMLTAQGLAHKLSWRGTK